MKPISGIITLAAIFCAAAVQAQEAAIQVLYPYEGQHIAAVPQTFIFGNVSPSSGTLTINGTPVKVHPKGTFLAYLPVSRGNFVFALEYAPADGKPAFTYQRAITVGQPLPAPLSADKPQLDKNSVQPAADVEYSAGDCVQISAAGSPEMKADFSIDGVIRHAEMAELPQGSGNYTGMYCIKPEDKASQAEIKVRLSKGWSGDKASAAGKLTIMPNTPSIAEVTSDLAGLRSDFDGGYFMFASSGTRIHVTGRIGGRLRAELGPARSGWIDDSKVKLLPPGTPLPKALLGTISTAKGKSSTKVRLEMTSQVPYTAQLDGDTLSIDFLYTRNFTNWIVYDSSDTMIRNIVWQQPDGQTSTVKINFRQGRTPWGYDITYAAGGYNIELRERPNFACKGKTPLKGLTVVLDPGHSPKKGAAYDGAIGPSGSFEYAVNYQIAKELELLLQQKGAKVVLTRNNETEDVPLQHRPGISWNAKGDLYLSIHNNALPDGSNPLTPDRGFSVYYYHPHSMAFGSHMLAAFQRRIPLPDEQLRFGDYLVLRQTQMPAILAECAYQIIPEQEQLILSQDFRKKLAAAMLEGVLSYMKSTAPQGCEISLEQPRRKTAGKQEKNKPPHQPDGKKPPSKVKK
ncbi:MAG: N-acetylmuramoyl-L-alanine amidase [Elusimicrobia bacterium]|nr:N-acetylmuramoyl-L-alanine amidase [Elusimicrobiota bacterium]